MKEKLVITLYDSFTNIDDRFLQEVAVQSSRIKKGFFKKRVLLIAAIIGAILLCDISSRYIRSMDTKNIDISNGNGAKRT